MMWQSILGIVDKILAHFTPERNTQRLKDELWKLKAEEQQLMFEKWSVKNEKRFAFVRTRIDIINRMLNDRAD